MDENCHVEPMQKNPTKSEQDQTTDAFFAVSGMGCPNCAHRVRNSIIELQGVIEAQVDHIRGAARVVYNPMMVNTNDLTQAVVRAGGDGRHEYFAQLLS
jgi:copper chaperone CopZ